MNVAAALTHFLIPQESNNHRARLLQIPVIALLFIVFLLSQNGIHTSTSPQILGYASQISTSEVIKLTNDRRAENGLGKVVENSDLDRAAKAKGLDMLAKGYWAHVSPDGTQPWDFFKSVGYKYRYAGENLARDFSNPSSAVDAWMASPSHRENMLSPRYKEIGVAVVDGSLNGKDATIIVQLFGTTMAGSPQIPVAAAADKDTVKSAVVETAPTQTNTIQQVEKIAVSAPSTESNPFLSSTVNYSRVLSLGMIGFIFMALVVDAGILWYRGVKRRGSKSFAQIAFFGLIIGLIIVAKVGQVL